MLFHNFNFSVQIMLRFFKNHILKFQYQLVI